MSGNPDDDVVIECVECGESLANCICNIEDELKEPDEDYEDEF